MNDMKGLYMGEQVKRPLEGHGVKPDAPKPTFDGNQKGVAMTKTPKGVVACFINESGRVIASATCFELDRPGGLSAKEAQKIRARERLHMNVANAYCSPCFVLGMSGYVISGIVDTLCHQHGCGIHYEYIGYEDAND